jgi:two-component system nitrate/nitrite response regulator NarL
MEPIRAVIVADVRFYRDGLAMALSHESTINVVGAAATLEEALSLIALHDPDLALVDIAAANDPLVDAVVRSNPAIRLVVLATEADEEVVSCAEAGFSGYLSRDASLEELVRTITKVADGEMPCSSRVAAKLAHRVATLSARQGPTSVRQASNKPLTRREAEIMTLVDQGLSNKQIAASLCIEVATVKNHIHNILGKLQVQRRGEAAAYFREALSGSPLIS